MTTSLMEDIASAPDDPEPPLFGAPELDDDTDDTPKRTHEPKEGKRGPRVRERECESCGKTFIGGRKVCSDCKGTTPKPSPRGNARLEEDLLESTISVASDISAVAPTVAGVLVSRAEVAVSGMMSLAKGHPRIEAMLKRTASVSRIADLASTVVMLVIAGMVDFGRIPLESPLLDRIGYADIVRDERGKAQRDERGTIVKERRTLREIHDMMTGEDSSSGMQVPPMWEPQNGVSPGAPNAFPAMNWTP